MEYISHFIDLFLHLDKHLAELIRQYGTWTYLILFAIIFLETGVVVTPFLPGDSLLFAAGTFAGMGHFDLTWLMILLTAAAIIGDAANYAIGKFLGRHIMSWGKGKLIKQQHLDRTHAFFEKYGGKTIIIARFVPIVRTLAPFVAGLGAMTYVKFQAYNIIGGIVWVVTCVLAGYYFGQREFVQKNFSVVVLGIVFVSVLPMVVEFILHKRRAAKERNAAIQPTKP